MQRTAKEAQLAALAEMKAKQSQFAEKVIQHIGNELEAHICKFSEDPSITHMLAEYNGASDPILYILCARTIVL
jgi:hypothetical protein